MNIGRWAQANNTQGHVPINRPGSITGSPFCVRCRSLHTLSHKKPSLTSIPPTTVNIFSDVISELPMTNHATLQQTNNHASHLSPNLPSPPNPHAFQTKARCYVHLPLGYPRRHHKQYVLPSPNSPSNPNSKNSTPN